MFLRNTPTLRHLIPLALFFLLVATAPLAAHAQESEQGEGPTQQETPQIDPSPVVTQTIPLYQGQLVYPQPAWMDGLQDLGNMQVFRQQQGNSFTFEQIPKDQDFDSWTQLYGVYAWYLPEYDLRRFVEESLGALHMGCADAAEIELPVSSEHGLIFSFFCPRLKEQLIVNGNDTETGLLYFGLVGHTFAKVYQSWRAPSSGDPDHPPVDRYVVQDMLERMKSIRFVPAQRN